jgi:putative ABC transport system ATP-binding protein
MLNLVGVTRSFPEGGRLRPVLKGVDLQVESGEFIGLLGPSGSGKSTLLNLVSGIDAPDGGTLQVAGTELHRLSEKDRTLFRRAHIGFLFQSFNLIPTLTVGENLLLPLELAGRVDDAGRGRARALLDRVGLLDREDAWPDRLSGGEQQRVALARALVHQPDLVLADEPTGNLDRDTGAVVLDLLDDLLRSSGATLLAVSHSTDVVERMDRVFVIRDGRLQPGTAPAP